MTMLLVEVVRRYLSDPEAGWSMGGFGALAEFHQDADEAALVDRPRSLTRATARGAIGIDPGCLGQSQPVAYEIPSPKPHRWSHGIAFCLPSRDARREARGALTELGPDKSAIRPDDRSSILFDMGLASEQCDFCIRTSDKELLDILRRCVGRSVFDNGNPAMSAILHSHPHRVAITNLGRVEVFQKIGGPETGGVSPAGPHTHVLPKLLASGRTHSANTPVPSGLTPCGYLHPGNAVIGSLGEDRSFDPSLHDAFQALLQAFGPQDLVDTKNRLISCLKAGNEARSFQVPAGRHHRAAVRVALRQLARTHAFAENAELTCRLETWRMLFDKTDSSAGSGASDHD
jgi:hypothetical protein